MWVFFLPIDAIHDLVLFNFLEVHAGFVQHDLALCIDADSLGAYFLFLEAPLWAYENQRGQADMARASPGSIRHARLTVDADFYAVLVCVPCAPSPGQHDCHDGGNQYEAAAHPHPHPNSNSHCISVATPVSLVLLFQHRVQQHVRLQQGCAGLELQVDALHTPAPVLLQHQRGAVKLGRHKHVDTVDDGGCCNSTHLPSVTPVCC
mmetsp:Transcript_25769/g.69901  ORF Transcript_25769/g.69901 Transcript_25769/m.69901 type:complete len:206 (-) Transcript_25769:1511-2128(-)